MTRGCLVPIRVFIADNHHDVRSGFRFVLNAQPDLRVVGEAADGVTAMERIRRLRPDVVLADIRIPGVDGLELTRRLAGPEVADPVRVVIVTTFDIENHVYAALRNGASGFLLKRSSPSLLVEAIRSAMSGDTLICPSVTVRLLRHLTPLHSAAQQPLTEPLTDRELDVVRLVAKGRTNTEIATELFISPGTAKTHIANIQHKLAVRNRVGIAAWAWATGHTTANVRDRSPERQMSSWPADTQPPFRQISPDTARRRSS